MSDETVVLKTHFVPVSDIRRFRVPISNFSFVDLQSAVATLYKIDFQGAPKYTIKYQDEDGDMITIACDSDFKEAIAWNNERNARQGPNARILPLHLVIVEGEKKTDKPKDDDIETQLVGITDLFVRTMNISGSDEDKKDPSPKKPKLKHKALSKSRLILGSEFRGILCYFDPTMDKYPLTLRVMSVKKNSVEGMIHWNSLGAATRWLGTFQARTDKLKFREYEAVVGEDKVQLPMNYSCKLIGDKLQGNLWEDCNDEKQKVKKVASFCLYFAGIQTKSDGFFSSSQSDLKVDTSMFKTKKRKYDLFTNSMLDAVTDDDRIASFMKLTAGSDCWYQKKRPNFEKRDPKQITKDLVARSCPICKEPINEIEENGKRYYKCSTYPVCYHKEEITDYMDDSYDESSENSDYYYYW